MIRVSGPLRAVPKAGRAAAAPVPRRAGRSAVRAVFLAAALALPAAAAAASDEAAVHCFDRSRLVAHLLAAYGETQQSVGYQEGRGIVEFFANKASGTWTILLTPAADTSCVLESGTRGDRPIRPETPA